MTTTICNPTARARDHERVNAILARLALKFPHCTPGELLDALSTARYDENQADKLIRAAVRSCEQVGEYLARIA